MIATRSSHKLAELAALLHPARAELIDLATLGVPGDPVEDGMTFEANARLKARFYARLTSLPTIADDSGIEVAALGGAPGVRTRRYAGEHATDVENNDKLLDALVGLPPAERGARYVCVLAFVEPDRPGGRGGRGGRGGLPVVAEARGTLRGRIAVGPRGSGGFGYDPIFEPLGELPGGRTLGQQSVVEKAAISHRSRAARRLGRRLAALGY
ncbi:MAG: non-canonical purine NTP pyrophosphatase [Candidatus Limnocylindrales bacterium]